MTGKMKIKMTVDFLMTVVLLTLMAYQITGQKYHEWFGAGMLVLFLVHNILNHKWYKNLLKGKYTAFRVMQLIVNLSILVSMFCLAYSGIVMSRYVFDFVSVDGQMALARLIHMAAAHWGFVLMSIHLGMHWGMITGRIKSKTVAWVLRSVAVVIACYGAVCFYKAKIVSFIFLINQFVFFDYEKSAVSVFGEYIAMMGLWVFVGYYLAKGIKKIS